jgi:tetratricopeptide (TPR) repeat protein
VQIQSLRAALACLLVSAGLVHSVNQALAETIPGEEAGSNAPSSELTEGDFPDETRVAALIQQLSSDRYVERRAAEQALLDRGMEVFDQIDAATQHIDPEVAASCKYVLSQLTISWARRDDPPIVKNYLARFGSLDESDRIRYAEMLSRMEGNIAAPALVRITRYDTSPRVSAYAAMYLLQRNKLDVEWDEQLAAVLRREAGASVRPAIRWVRALATQIESPDQAVATWDVILNNFRKLADEADYDETKQQQYATLLWNLFRVGVQRDDWSTANGMIDELLTVSPAEYQNTLAVAMTVAVDDEAWPLLDHALENHRDMLDGSKDLLYRAAHARHAQGEIDAANMLADEALAVDEGEAGSAVISDALGVAMRIQREDHADWARREYRQAIDNSTAGSATHAVACYWLSDSLHDWQEYEEAAQVIGELAEVLRNNSQASANYRRMQDRGFYNSVMPSVDGVYALEQFYLACQQRELGDSEKQWEYLKKASEHEDSNADILIAMYRASEPNSDKRKLVLKKIERLSQTFLQAIDQMPDDATAYNQWAWLISNTEGDFQKAIRYSHRSLEINPGAAGYLDTLGRCYFAAGDYKNAVKYQREAVEIDPSMKVLHRQLAEFEAALAEKSNG